jgi:hypothetical protein
VWIWNNHHCELNLSGANISPMTAIPLLWALPEMRRAHPIECIPGNLVQNQSSQCGQGRALSAGVLARSTARKAAWTGRELNLLDPGIHALGSIEK